MVKLKYRDKRYLILQFKSIFHHFCFYIKKGVSLSVRKTWHPIIRDEM